MNYTGKKVLVLGWARSGKAAFDFLIAKGANVFLTADEKPKNFSGKFIDYIDSSFDVLIKNPGINYENKIVKDAIDLKIPVITEVQLALDYFEGQLIAVTGTNGKTTTTLLISNMLEQSKIDFQVAGNIGKPVSELMLENPKNILLEISSFQLLGTPRIKPDIALITNISDSHLDYHGNKNNYISAKLQITSNQDENDLLVINREIKDKENINVKTKAKVIEFGNHKLNNSTVFFENNMLVVNGVELISEDEIILKGSANKENVIAAVIVAKSVGVDDTSITKTLKTFKGAEHRLEFIGRFNNIKVFNDSKATDATATINALSSFENDKVTWIAGGLDRKEDLTPLSKHLKQVNTAIFFGETKEELKKIAEDAKVENVYVFNDLKTSISKAIEAQNNVILFSPAAASWDQYENFEIRGDEFKKLIKEGLGK